MPILTLEPLLEVVREELEEAGWSLSGIQKTTSYEFDGRWSDESTRSAYVFFHPADAAGQAGPAHDPSVDVFLDETSRGLRGSLTLAIEGPELGKLAPVAPALEMLAGLGEEVFGEEVGPEVSVKSVLSARSRAGPQAGTRLRIRVPIPRPAITAGASAVEAVVRNGAAGFRTILAHPSLGDLLARE